MVSEIHLKSQQLGGRGKVDLCEFEASLVYRMSSRAARAVTQRNPVSKNKQTNKQNPYVPHHGNFFISFSLPLDLSHCPGKKVGRALALGQ